MFKCVLLFCFVFSVFCEVTIDTQASPMNLECASSNLNVYYQWLATRGGATARSTCGDVIWGNNAPTRIIEKFLCEREIEVSFYALDLCGDVLTTNATITIVDTTSPTFVQLPSDANICSNSITQLNEYLYANGYSIAIDQCSENLLWSNNYSGFNPSGGSQVVSFFATDSCGNMASASATITQVQC